MTDVDIDYWRSELARGRRHQLRNRLKSRLLAYNIAGAILLAMELMA
jgi:hypothetical protein